MTDIPFLNHLEPPYSITWSGTWHAGDVITIGWTDATVNAPCGPFLYATNGLTNGGDTLAQINQGAHGPVSRTFTLAHDCTQIKFNAFCAAYCSAGTLLGVTITPTGAAGYCQYGTEPNPAATYYEVVTDSLIDLVVGGTLAGTGNAELIPYVETALLAIEGTIWLGANCATLPGAGPTLDFPNLQNLSIDTLKAWFYAAAWNFFCRCVPASGGDPAPISPPAPPIIPPGTVVLVEPAPLCDNQDLCTYLQKLKAEIQNITAQLSYARRDIQLIQRQGVPFGYVVGTPHTGLTGAGDFTVSDILGLSVSFSALPTYYGLEGSDPPAYLFLGEIALGNTAGWENRVRLTRSPQLLFPVSGAITKVGYLFPPGAVATITELLREP